MAAILTFLFQTRRSPIGQYQPEFSLLFGNGLRQDWRISALSVDGAPKMMKMRTGGSSFECEKRNGYVRFAPHCRLLELPSRTSDRDLMELTENGRARQVLGMHLSRHRLRIENLLLQNMSAF